MTIPQVESNLNFSTYEKILKKEKKSPNHEYTEKIVGKQAPNVFGYIFGENEYHYDMNYYNKEKHHEIYVESFNSKSKKNQYLDYFGTFLIVCGND